MLYLTFNSLGSKTRFGQVINGNEIHRCPPKSHFTNCSYLLNQLSCIKTGRIKLNNAYGNAL